MRFPILLFFLFVCTVSIKAQNYSIKASVLLWVETQEAPASITLNWIADPDATNYYVFRKTKSATTWGNFIANVSKDSTRYVDKNIEVGKGYEYRVSKVSPVSNGFGYVYAGIKLPETDSRGSILLLVDSLVNVRLKTEIETWKSDVSNESWNVLTYVPSAKNTVVEIRTKIADLKRTNPDLKSIFILGHVKVPYSGDIAPDGHSDHIGAWPCDSYYGELDGSWTDVNVNDVSAGRAANKNIPGDGKFDQSSLPSDVDLEVGRVDFYDMPAFTKSEIELLRAYLNKNHKWRTGQINAVKRGIVLDNFNFAGEAFGQSGMRNFSSFFGPSNVEYGNYRDSLLKKSYLWSYGAGGGWYEGAGGISTTQNMAVDSLQSVFTFLFGSYFGDWDSPNNFLRAALASGTILSNAWSGRPLWSMHYMAMGDPIGLCGKLSINNSNLYQAGFGARSTHVALMGDPSLIMYPIAAPESLEAVETGPHIDLKWRKSSEASNGYNVYRRITGNSIYEVSAKNVMDTFYRDMCPFNGFKYEYLVRAVKLETTASGSFYNLSAGVRDTITKVLSVTPKADFTFTKDYEFIHLKSEAKNARSVRWIIGKDTLTSTEVDAVLDCDKSPQSICLIAVGDCDEDFTCKSISFDCSIPKISKIRIDSIKCNGGKATIEIEDLIGADPFSFKWNTGETSNKIANLAAGSYEVTITSAKNTNKVYVFNMIEPAVLSANYAIRSASPGKNDGGISNLVISGGTPPYTFKILNENPDSLRAGDYNLIITDSNNCTTSIKISIPVRTATSNPDASFEIYPTLAKDYLNIKYKNQSNILRMRILDVQGISLRDLSNSESRIYIGKLNPGWYVLQAITAKGTEELRFEKM